MCRVDTTFMDLLRKANLLTYKYGREVLTQ